MIRRIAPILFAMSVPALIATVNPTIAQAAKVGEGAVTSVNFPGQASAKEFAVANGDIVEVTTYEPQQDDPEFGYKKGMKYNMLVVTKMVDGKRGPQSFIVFDVNEPTLERQLKGSSTIQGIGTTNQSIQKGDKVVVSTQAAAGGGTDVTFDVFRANKSVATFSFVRK